MTGRIILYSGWLTPALCDEHSDKVFVFGDNTKRFGMGGQAIIRNNANVLGIPTKRKPAMTPTSFFEEGNEADEDSVLWALEEVWAKLRLGYTIVMPVTRDGKPSIGLERAELPDRAPSIYAAICQHVEEMSDAYGDRQIHSCLPN